MNIYYKKTDKGYDYQVKEEWGEITFRLDNELKNEELLDDIFMAIFNLKDKAEKLVGKIEVDDKLVDRVGQKQIPYQFIKQAKMWDEVFSEDEKKHIGSIIGVDFNDIRRKDLDMLSKHYADCGYRITPEFKKQLTNFKKKYEQKN